MSRFDDAIASVRAALFGSRLRRVATVLGVFVVAILGAFTLGVLGAPAVEGVDNRFGNVSNDTTMVHSNLTVNNPNPFGIQRGNATVSYTVRMNDVPIAEGGREGLDIESGNSTLAFTTRMDNQQIPPWWASHVNNDEQTTINIDATIRTSIIGLNRYDVAQEKQVETDIIGDFNSNETRPVESDDAPPTFSDPTMYVNRTSAEWGEATEEETPINMQFRIYNPQTLPYTIAELGYTITMNDVQVGEGKTDALTAIPPQTARTVETEASIINPNLDDWWVTHLRNDQVTDLRIEFYVTLAGDGLTEDVRVPLDQLTYEETIETDIFGNKDTSSDGPNGTPTPTDGDRAPTPTPTDTDVLEPVDTPTETDLV